MKGIRNSLGIFVRKPDGRSRGITEDISKIDVTQDCKDLFNLLLDYPSDY
jgi:hypothetical protein